jgi:Holliday junction resolvase
MTTKRKNSRAKGANGEREAAKYLCSLGFAAERCARNGVAGGDDLIVRDLPHVHIEVKRDESLRDDGALMDRYWEQAVDCCGGRAPCVLWRTSNRRWRLTFPTPGGIRVTATGDARIAESLLILEGNR